MNPQDSKDQPEQPSLEDDEDDIINPDDVQETITLDDDAQVPDDEEEVSPEEMKLSGAFQEALQTVANDDSDQGFLEHKESVFCVAISPDGGRAVSGDGDNFAYVWDVKTADIVHKLEGHSDSVIDTGFSADGKFLATGSMDGTIRVYDANTFQLSHSLEGPAAELEWMEWHPKGNVLASGAADHTAWIWNAATGVCMQALAGHLGPVTCGAWTADGKILSTGSEDNTIFVWNPKTGKPKHHLKGFGFHDAPVTCLASHPDASQPLLISGSVDHTAKIIHLETGKVLCNLRGHKDGVEAVAFCKAMPWAATAGVDGQIIVWDVRNGQTRLKLAHKDAVTRILWHPTEPLLFSSSLDKTIKQWDARSGQCVKTWTGHHDAVLDIALSTDATTIVSASDDHSALVFRTHQ